MVTVRAASVVVLSAGGDRSRLVVWLVSSMSGGLARHRESQATISSLIGPAAIMVLDAMLHRGIVAVAFRLDRGHHSAAADGLNGGIDRRQDAASRPQAIFDSVLDLPDSASQMMQIDRPDRQPFGPLSYQFGW